MKKLTSHGYTIVELLIVISVSSILIGLVLAFTINYSRFAASLQLISDSLTDRLNVSDYLREKLSASSGLSIQTTIADTNAGNPDTSISPAYYWKKIHAIPKNITPGSDGTYTPVLYFRRFSQSTNGSYIQNGTAPYEDEYVLYLNNDDKTLYVRSIANPNAPNNRLLTSCPASIATAACPADAKLIGNVASIDTKYFSRSGNLIDWTSIYDSINSTYIGPDFPTVEVVELKVNTTTKATYQANTLNSSTIIRIAVRNT